MKQIRKLKHRPTEAQTTGKTHTNRHTDEKTHRSLKLELKKSFFNAFKAYKANTFKVTDWAKCRSKVCIS